MDKAAWLVTYNRKYSYTVEQVNIQTVIVWDHAGQYAGCYAAPMIVMAETEDKAMEIARNRLSLSPNLDSWLEEKGWCMRISKCVIAE